MVTYRTERGTLLMRCSGQNEEIQKEGICVCVHSSRLTAGTNTTLLKKLFSNEN